MRTSSGSHKTISSSTARPQEYRSVLQETCWLSANTFELKLSRPEGFAFRAGQHIRLHSHGFERDYSPTSGPEESPLALCIRHVPDGGLTPALASLEPGAELAFSGPRGHFAFRPSDLPAVFIATGTGIAPFVSMARSGVRGFLFLHGVREPEELYYEEVLRDAAGEVVPCLSGRGTGKSPRPDAFSGRVSAYVGAHLPRRAYDFYLCGREEMIRDVTLLVDESFPGSRVYAEIFFAGAGD